MRYTTRAGKRAQKGSSNGWGTTPVDARVCPVCGVRVTLKDNSVELTIGAVTTVTHTACRTAG